MKKLIPFLIALAMVTPLFAGGASEPAAKPVETVAVELPGPELYPGEKELYAKAAAEGMVVSFDTGPTWANWKKEFDMFSKRYPLVQLVYNDLGSGATVVALDKARNRPQADTAYYFAASGIDALQKGVLEPFMPVNADKLPSVFKAEKGEWFTVHQLVIAFLVNKKLVKNVPQTWQDLLKPEYANSIVYLDPRSTGQGQVLVFGANFGNGGTMENITPGIDFFSQLHKAGNVLRVEGTTPYAKFLKGEIPIYLGYENDGLKAKYLDGMGDDVAVVIPKEASVAAPYALSLVKNGPHPNAGKLWLNWTMSDAGQKIFADGFVRPSVPGITLTPDMLEKMPPAPQVIPLDLVKSAAKKQEVDQRWSQAALGK
jgi:putative spermidine/putrescine transport system substrate-binding protein